jgi:hypothetical protein
MLDPNQRLMLAQLADVIIPADGNFPSASEAGVAGNGLDETICYRPDFVPGLKLLLENAAAAGRPAAEFLTQLRCTDPAAFGLLTEVVASAYFLNAQVKAKLGYAGQGPRPIEPHPDYLEEGLLQSVIDRGPIYRPTPGRAASTES